MALFLKTRLCCGAGQMHWNHNRAHEPFLSNIEVEFIYSWMVNIQIILYINECMLFFIVGLCCKVAVCSSDRPIIGQLYSCMCVYIVLRVNEWEPEKCISVKLCK